MNRQYSFSSESVSDGHPDKVADQIADAVLDEYLKEDPAAKVACEVLIAKDALVISGEFTTLGIISFANTAKRVLNGIGYNNDLMGFNSDKCHIVISTSRQSPDIARAIHNSGKSMGAGDQGIMFGYATDETPELMPLPILLAHRLMQRQSTLRKSGSIKWLRPDGKCQVTVRYEGIKPLYVEKVVLSAQHAPQASLSQVRETLKKEIIDNVIPEALRSPKTEYLINPGGLFNTGGPKADTGLTGRKIVVDTYGGSCPHGGGAFSGKDPTKVDRSAAYMARYVAKNIVSAGLAKRCLVQLAYAIGRPEPVSVMVDTLQTGEVDEIKLEKAVQKVFDLTPQGIIASLNLRRPIYLQTSVFGHFGRELPDFYWEKTDKAGSLKKIMLAGGLS